MSSTQDTSTRQKEFIVKIKEYIADLSKEAGRPLSCGVVNFGCQMNARDSEKLLGILLEAGFEKSLVDEDADFVIYNTCTVRDNANQKVYGRLGRLKSTKKNNPYKKIALCGCMMQEDTCVDKIRKSYPYVDLIFGTHNLFCFPELLYKVYAKGERVIEVWDKTDVIMEDLPIHRKYSFKSGVNIMFGCNNFCSYCIVPYVRGRERSRDMEDILDEIRNLAKDGVKEIMLLGQNVNSYGKNLEKPVSFSELLTECEKIEGIERIRFMTSHPKDLSDDLIQVMKNSKKICHHLHLPMQSGSSRILKAMNRQYSKESYLSLVDRIRTQIPDIALTTDIIVGFPGETHEDVDDTIDVIRKAQFDNAFTFIYSKRTGTPAAAMENQVPEEITKKEFDRVLSTVQEVARIRVSRYEGEIHEALVEEINSQDATLVTGRLSNNTIVHFKGEASLIGQIVKVKLTKCEGFYYLGELI